MTTTIRFLPFEEKVRGSFDKIQVFRDCFRLRSMESFLMQGILLSLSEANQMKMEGIWRIRRI